MLTKDDDDKSWAMITDLEIHIALTQLAFTCWKSTIETLEQGVKYVQS